MVNKTSRAVVMVLLCAPLVSGALWEDRGEYVEVPTGMKLCDPGEDVYGYYLIMGPMNADKTQDVMYYRFGALIDMKTGLQQRIWQPIGGSSRWIKRHPRDLGKLQIINPHTGEADEFLYTPCKKQ